MTMGDLARESDKRTHYTGGHKRYIHAAHTSRAAHTWGAVRCMAAGGRLGLVWRVMEGMAEQSNSEAAGWPWRIRMTGTSSSRC